MREPLQRQPGAIKQVDCFINWRRIIVFLCLWSLILSIIYAGSSSVYARYVLHEQISFIVSVPSAGG